MTWKTYAHREKLREESTPLSCWPGKESTMRRYAGDSGGERWRRGSRSSLKYRIHQVTCSETQ